jgi:superfamily II DNA or RNA helicase
MLEELDSFRKRRRVESGASLRCGLRLPYETLSPNERVALQKRLTFHPPDRFEGSSKALPVYRLEEDALVVPRCALSRPARDELADGEAFGAEFVGALRPQQEEARAAALGALRAWPHACMLVLPCGFGKTVLSLAIASALGRRALVVVHKEFLMTQWRERIASFLPSASVGVVQGSTCQLDRDIVIAMLQTLVQREEFESGDLLARCGLAVFDECHHLAARLFSDLFFRVPCRHLLGLTATPKRKDGCTAALHHFLGPCAFSSEHCGIAPETVRVECVRYRALSRDSHQELTPQQTERLKTRLAADETRARLVTELCAEAVARERRVLVLAHRLQHLRRLRELLADARPECATGLYVGGLKAEERERAAAAQVIFATYSMAAEGLDIPALDLLVLASPTGDVTQAVGRVLRPCADKPAPVVLDVVDASYLPFRRSAEARARYYSRAGFVTAPPAETETVCARLRAL